MKMFKKSLWNIEKNKAIQKNKRIEKKNIYNFINLHLFWVQWGIFLSNGSSSFRCASSSHCYFEYIFGGVIKTITDKLFLNWMLRNAFLLRQSFHYRRSLHCLLEILCNETIFPAWSHKAVADNWIKYFLAELRSIGLGKVIRLYRLFDIFVECFSNTVGVDVLPSPTSHILMTILYCKCSLSFAWSIAIPSKGTGCDGMKIASILVPFLVT